jgi:hypothetical protein
VCVSVFVSLISDIYRQYLRPILTVQCTRITETGPVLMHPRQGILGANGKPRFFGVNCKQSVCDTLTFCSPLTFFFTVFLTKNQMSAKYAMR